MRKGNKWILKGGSEKKQKRITSLMMSYGERNGSKKERERGRERGTMMDFLNSV